MPGIVDSFKKGFECAKMPEFKSLLLIFAALSVGSVILSAVIPIVPSIFFGFFFTIYLYWKVLQNLKVKTKNWDLGINNFIAYIKYLVVNFVIVLFNWPNKKIFWSQVGLYIVTAAVFSISFALSSVILSILGLLMLVAAFILIVYNSLHYFVALPVRLVEARGTINAFERAWPLTKGRVWNILGIQILLVLFGIVLMIPSILLGIAGVLSGNIVLFFLTIGLAGILFVTVEAYLMLFGAFVVTNYYFALNREKKK